MIIRLLTTIIAAAAMTSPAYADCDDLDDVMGYTLVAKKTVVAHIDDGKRSEGYSGCTYNRILVFEDNTGLTCASYEYDYAYRPDAYIFVDGSRVKVCIDDETLDMRHLR